MERKPKDLESRFDPSSDGHFLLQKVFAIFIYLSDSGKFHSIQFLSYTHYGLYYITDT